MEAEARCRCATDRGGAQCEQAKEFDGVRLETPIGDGTFCLNHCSAVGRCERSTCVCPAGANPATPCLASSPSTTKHAAETAAAYSRQKSAATRKDSQESELK